MLVEVCVVVEGGTTSTETGFGVTGVVEAVLVATVGETGFVVATGDEIPPVLATGEVDEELLLNGFTVVVGCVAVDVFVVEEADGRK